jgi:hypothetical protein
MTTTGAFMTTIVKPQPVIKQVGVIGVDAGLCWLGDPCYIFKPEQRPKAIGKDWSGFCDKLSNDYPTCQQFNYDGGHPGLGVVVSTGHGDGEYPVFAEIVAGRVVKVWVDFSDSDEIED